MSERISGSARGGLRHCGVGTVLAAMLTLGLATGARALTTFRSIVLPTAMTNPSEWRYTVTNPGSGWEKSGFEDSAWSSGLSGFGTRKTPGGAAYTDWLDSAIWLRRTVAMPSLDSLDGLSLLIHHDENAEVYVNGTLIWLDTGYTVDYKSFPLDAKARAAFKAGDNLIAVHCSQTKGGQYIDLGFETSITGQAITLLADARTEAQTWKYTTEDPATSNWSGAGFNDAAWSSGQAGFGAAGTPGLTFNTAWNTGDIWLRKAFVVDSTPYNHFFVTVQHDEDVTILINGKLALQRVGYITRYLDFDITEAVKGIVKPGANMLAVWCHQTTGGQFIDVGLKAVLTQPPVALVEAKRNRPGNSAVTGRAQGARTRVPVWAWRGYRLFSADGRAAPVKP